MANARLHIICGNCGNGDKKYFSFEIVKDFIDYGGRQEDDVLIKCKNCCTIHVLSNVLPEKGKETKQ